MLISYYMLNWKDLSKKKKTYIGALAVIVGVLVWAFISAGVITHNFNRSQLQTDQPTIKARAPIYVFCFYSNIYS